MKNTTLQPYQVTVTFRCSLADGKQPTTTPDVVANVVWPNPTELRICDQTEVSMYYEINDDYYYEFSMYVESPYSLKETEEKVDSVLDIYCVHNHFEWDVEDIKVKATMGVI
jgi:hypothetical protein